jgi:hypothetical protein
VPEQISWGSAVMCVALNRLGVMLSVQSPCNEIKTFSKIQGPWAKDVKVVQVYFVVPPRKH